MLVLTIKTGEQLVIGDVVVTVVKQLNDKVRLGIEAPMEMPVSRRENTKKQEPTKS